MSSNTHHCIVCGKGYKFCDSCCNVRGYTPWRVIADAPECYQVHLLIATCKRDDATDADFENLRILSDKIDMKPEVAVVVNQLLEDHK